MIHSTVKERILKRLSDGLWHTTTSLIEDCTAYSVGERICEINKEYRLLHGFTEKEDNLILQEPIHGQSTGKYRLNPNRIKPRIWSTEESLKKTEDLPKLF